MLRGRWLISIVTALTLCSAATAVAAVARLRSADSPTSVIQRYFGALARADAATALSLSDRPVTGPYLSAQVLRQQLRLAPISQVRVRSIQAAGAGRKRVTVSYRLGFASGAQVSTDTVELIAHGRSWRLNQVAAEVTVASSEPGWLTLAGAVLPRSALLFPGALPVASGWSGLSVVNRPAVSLGSSEVGTVSVLTAVNPTGRALVDTAMRAALTRCLEVATPRCPLPSGVRAVPGSLRGQIAQLSASQVQLADGRVLRVHAEATVRGSYSAWDFENIAQTRTGTVQLALSALTSVAAPAVMYWQP